MVNLLQNQKSYDIDASGTQSQVYINDDPGLTLTRSNWVTYTFEWGKTVMKSFNGENLQWIFQKLKT